MKNKPQLIRISFYLNVLGTCARTNINNAINVYTKQKYSTSSLNNGKHLWYIVSYSFVDLSYEFSFSILCSALL